MFSNEDRPVPEKKEETGYKMKQIYLLDPRNFDLGNPC